MKKPNAWQRFIKSENGPILLVLLGFIVAVGIINGISVQEWPPFLSPLNLGNVLTQNAIIGIVCLGMTFVMISGGIDLSVGWLASLVACAVAFFIRSNETGETNIPIFLLLIFGIVIGIAAGALIGFIISRTKIEPFIITLGFMTIFQGFTYLITYGREIKVGDTVMWLGRAFPISFDFGDAGKLNIGSPVLIFLALTFICWFVLKYTKFGMRVYAIGSNENASFLAGIKVKNFKMSIYMLNGAFVALAGMTQMSKISIGSATITQGWEISAIAGVVVGGTAMAGGKGNIWGTFIGIFTLGIISNALNILGVDPYYQFVLKGVVIIIAVLIGYFSSVRNLAKSRAALEKHIEEK